MTLGEQCAVLALVHDLDYALTNFVRVSRVLDRAIDRLREVGDDEGIDMLRALVGEHFEDPA